MTIMTGQHIPGHAFYFC